MKTTNKTTKRLASRQMQKPALLVVVLTALSMGIGACGLLNTDGSEGIGHINFHISNTENIPAPAKFTTNDELQGNHGDNPPNRSLDGLEEVNIDVQQLRVRFSEVRPDTVTQNDTVSVVPVETEARWIDVEITPQMINLMELEGSDLPLAEAELPEGFYSEIRLVLGNDNSVVVDGETRTLFVPSGSASGYKIKFGERLHSGQVMDLILEFNARQSIHVTGNGRYMLQPILRVLWGQET